MDTDHKIWKPLDESKRQIRLFILSPDPNINAWPKGRLIVRSLDEQLHYEAISYAWGEISAPYPLLIDGIELSITWTLTNLLAQLRHRTVEKCFWIDAVCIDQNDLEDRAQQVQLMQHIFHRAGLVRVWLGDEPADVAHLVNQISLHDDFISEYMSSKARQYVRHRSDWPHSSSWEAQNNGYAETPPAYIRALHDLMQQIFFQRLWVVQELALARDVVFHYDAASMGLIQMRSLSAGRDQLLKVLYSLTLSEVDRWAVSIYDGLECIDQAVNLLPVATIGTPEDKGFALMELLSSCRKKQVFDARDRIYGLLGVMTAMFGMDFMKADYNLSLAEVYTAFAHSFISHTGTLVLLNQSDYTLNSTIGLPTWVPDWASRFDMYRSGKALR